MSDEPDPLNHVPDPATLRHLIAANVRRTELLRQMLRLALRCETFERSHRSTLPVTTREVAHAD